MSHNIPIFDSSTISIACISDTHNETPTSELPDADILIHSGDIANAGTPAELKAAYQWVASLPYRVKIVVPGNNDRSLCPKHPNYDAESSALFTSQHAIDNGVHYLIDSTSTVAQYRTQSGQIKPIKVYGNPSQPDYFLVLGPVLPIPVGFWYLPYPHEDSFTAWKHAPTHCEPRTADDMDAAQVWVTHSPPKDRLDYAPPQFHAVAKKHLETPGCKLLARKIARARPLLSVFGHLHGGCGVERIAWKDDKDEVAQSKVLAVQNNDVGSLEASKRHFEFTGDNALNKHETLFVNAAWMPIDRKTVSRRSGPWLITIDFEAWERD